MSADVCLIIPPSPFLLDERVFPSLGILRVAASLESQGASVDLLDLSGVSNHLEVLEVYLRSHRSTYRFGITATTPQYPQAHSIARRIRELNPGAQLIIGGPHPTLVHAAARTETKNEVRGRGSKALETMKRDFDVVVAGDGDLITKEVMFAHDSDVRPYQVIDADDPKAPLFMTDASYEKTPLPARHLIDLESYRYQIEGHKATSLIGQLGCPFQCFGGNTKIIVAQGSNKKASEVIVGDKLVALNEKTNELEPTTVIETFSRDVEEIYQITLENGKKIQATDEHPFYVRGEWVKVKDLVVGDEIYEITPKDKMRVKMKFFNPVDRADVRERISRTVAERHADGTLSSDHLKNKSLETIEKMRAYRNLPETRDAARERMLGDKNPMKRPEIAAKATQTMAARVSVGECQYFMNTQEYWDKVQLSPNKQEQDFNDLLTAEFGDRFQFTGDGSFRVEHYAPDFVWKDEKKIIEYHGCWWHGCPRCYPEKDKQRKRDADRERVYRKNDYKVHVVWSCDFRDRRDETLANLRAFVWNGAKIESIVVLKKKTKVYNYSCYPHNNFFAEYILSHNCGFCGGRLSPMLRRIRTRSTENIIAEVRMLNVNHGYTGFMFYDDEMNVSKSMVELMDSLTRLQDELKTEFRLRGFVKAELFTEEQAQAMKRAGFRWLLTGFESGSPKILENSNKRANQDENTRAADIAHEAGLKVKALMSIGHPGESVETIEDTRSWLLRVKPEDFDVTIITTYPGSPYYDAAVETKPGIWTYTAKSGDVLHAIELDYSTTADYYKGDPDGGYKAYVYTDYLSSDELIGLRDDLEKTVRGTLGIPFNQSAAAINYEHSMGQGLPDSILRTTRAKESAGSKRVVRLPVIK